MEILFELISERLSRIEKTLESLKKEKLREEKEKYSNALMNVKELAQRWIQVKNATFH